MNSLLRRLLAKYYGIIMLITLVGASVGIYYSPRTREDLALAITVVGSVFSFFFIIQKQASEDIRLFKELFIDFNRRYDGLNEELNRIVGKGPETPLTVDETNTLYDYFNLCGEEFLYYKQGFIISDVWKAWCNGMHSFIQNPRINPLWTEEEKSESYYGLTLEKIRKEANQRTSETRSDGRR